MKFGDEMVVDPADGVDGVEILEAKADYANTHHSEIRDEWADTIRREARRAQPGQSFSAAAQPAAPLEPRDAAGERGHGGAGDGADEGCLLKKPRLRGKQKSGKAELVRGAPFLEKHQIATVVQPEGRPDLVDDIVKVVRFDKAFDKWIVLTLACEEVHFSPGSLRSVDASIQAFAQENFDAGVKKILAEGSQTL